jgi:hypothetical protein
MRMRYGVVLLGALAACGGPVAESDVPGTYCASSTTLPVSCVTLRVGGESTYELSNQAGVRSPTMMSGHWSFQSEKGAALVVLAEFPLHSDRGEAGRGFQILRAEKARDEVRLYADYDVNAYYLKRHSQQK